MINATTVFDIIFHSDAVFQICCVFTIVFHWEANFDNCCTLGEQMELFEQFLPHLSEHWFKTFIYIYSVIQQSECKEPGKKVLLPE
jgi:hypothetical protein